MWDIKKMVLDHLFEFILIPLVVAMGALFYTKAPWIKQDNPIEEAIEVIIEQKTGYDVDLSPATPEKKDTDGDKERDK